MRHLYVTHGLAFQHRKVYQLLYRTAAHRAHHAVPGRPV